MDLRLPQNDGVFSYYTPNRVLAPYISYYSITTPRLEYSSFSPLFIPDLGGSLIVSRYRHDLGLMVWGPFSKLTGIEDSLHEILAQYFIEFQPGGLSRLIYPNSSELLNRKIPLAEIDLEIYSALKLIFEQHCLTPNEIVSFLDEYFLGLLTRRKDVFANGRHILSVLQGFEPDRAMSDLSQETHYSARHINRYLHTTAGVSGKNYIQIKRFNKATRILKENKCSVEQVAFQLGYYDAAHFIHAFTELSGVSPSHYRKNVSDFYSESSKKL